MAASLIVGAGLLTAPAAVAALADREPSAARTVPALSERCGPEPDDAAGWEALFDGLAGDWAGGDGAASVRLPDGRLLWLFGDTFVGSVGVSGRRSSSTRIVRNSVVVTDGGCASVVTPGREALRGGSDGTWLWPMAGVVTRAASPGGTSELVVTAQRVARTSSDAFGFARVGAAVVRVTVPWRGVPEVGVPESLPLSPVLWGAALVREGATTWIYGTRAVAEPLVFGRELMLAQAPTSSAADPASWTYRTAAGWSRRATKARPVRTAREGVSTVPSAARVGGRYVIVTKAQEFVDPLVVELSAPHPWGPWTARTLLSAATDAEVLRYSPALVAGATSTHAVVVVSRTSTSMARLMSDAESARPSFADVSLG